VERIGLVTASEVRDLLNTIVDPCSVAAGAPAGLADMGLVRTVEVDDHTVSVRIGLTEPGCMMGASFVVRARELLAAQPGVEAVTVELYERRLVALRARGRPRPKASP
jgi:metal-sulfur cluster biosynthetic enzyme